MKLEPLIDGLLYPSEDDCPFDPIDWDPGPASGRAAVAAHLPAGATIEQLAPAAFFDPLRDATDAARFAALRAGLSALADLSGFRASDGTAEVQVYLVGRDGDGRWVGVHTVSVET